MAHPFPLFESIWTPNREIAVAPDVTEALRHGAVVAIGVSGGKDSAATAFATVDYLNEIGHQGPRLLIHSDLGRVEWHQSISVCEQLAAHLDLELMVVRRRSGDLLDRWHLRWENNVRRYAELSCVKLIMPWSTASMRFCTSELKIAVISRALVERFPNQMILSASGIRRQESANRARAPVSKAQPKLRSVSRRTSGLDWHPILDWTTQQVFEYLEQKGFPLHEAYRVYGSSRVSCCFCILGSANDLAAAARCEANHDVYRALVRLESASTFTFQPSRWLGDVAPRLLDAEERSALSFAKERARWREAAESRIPAHLLYTDGWPRCLPTRSEALLLCDVRRSVAGAVGIEVDYTDPERLIQRYQDLLAAAA
jgi:3'-phosphoadenosine 5'-phosphosulfate sulfotransferase (PAPS reductase)/FAD synthetase